MSPSQVAPGYRGADSRGEGPGDPGLSEQRETLEHVTARRSSPVFVGRARESADLRDALARAAAGMPVAVVVGGEAGVGKSRLVTETATAAAADGWRVVTGQCVELGSEGLPFAPITGVLRQLVREDGLDAVRALAPAGAAELASLLPELGDTGSSAPEGTGRARLLEVMLSLLERLGRAGPVLLVIEDLHWADRSTRELLAFLVRSLQQTPIALLVTYRSDEVRRGHPLRALLGELDRQHRVVRLELERFSASEVAELLHGLTGTPPTPALVERIHSRSDGNAFFVEELAACDAGDVAITESLRDVLIIRVEQLSDPAQALLRVAATAGQRIGHDLLAQVSGLPVDGLDTALRESVDSGILRTDDDGHGYAFRHALVREAVHDDLLPGEHARLHARLAAAIDADPALVGHERVATETAHHWYAAHDLPRAFAAALAAAKDGRTRLAFAEQQRMLERALELWERVPDPQEAAKTDWPGLVEQTYKAAVLAGETDRALALVELALTRVDAQDVTRRAGLLRSRGRLRRDLGRTGSLVDHREAVALLADQPPSHLKASVLAELAAEHGLRPSWPDAHVIALQAIAVAREVGHRRVELRATVTLSMALMGLGRADEALEAMDSAREGARDTEFDDVFVRATSNYGDLLHGLGRHAEAAEVARAGIPFARRHGHIRTGGAFLTINMAESLIALGRWDEALDLVDGVLQLDPPPTFLIFMHMLQGNVAVGRGELQQAAAYLEAARPLLARHYMGTQYTRPLRTLEASIAVASGDVPRALEVVREVLEPFPDPDPRYDWPLILVGTRAAADQIARARALRAGDGTADTVPLELIRRRADETDRAPSFLGLSAVAYRAHYAAEIARIDAPADEDPRDGVVRWDAVIDAYDAMGDPFPAAQALLCAADCAAAAGDRDGVARRLTRAGRIAAELRARQLQRDIADLARRARVPLDATAPDEHGGGPGGAGITRLVAPRSGAEPPAAADGAADAVSRLGLTPREVEVLRLLTQGRTNRQVAEALFISSKTASVHVSNILAKLGVTGRGEAAATAHRLRLFTSADA